MALTNDMKALVKDEVNSDPVERGYSGKTNAEIATLLNDGYNQIVTTEVPQPARINTIFDGVPFAPNVVTEGDVADALA